MVSMNKLTVDLVMSAINNKDVLKIEDMKVAGATVVDMGVKVPGSIEAGVYLAKICMGGLGEVSIVDISYGDIVLPSITEYTDHPIEACLASQLAGWKVSVGKYFAMGSGPARILARKPKKLYEELGYSEDVDEAVLALETDNLPNEEVIKYVSDATGVKPENLYIVVAPTNSVAGSVQISARIVETAIHKLHTLGFEVKSIKYGWGRCPIAPLHPSSLIMLGRTNDMLLYGGEVTLIVNYEEEEKLKGYVKDTPSTASKDYGVSLAEKIKEIGMEFLYKVDPKLFAPAILTVNNVRSGKTFKAGKINVDVIKKAIGFEEV